MTFETHGNTLVVSGVSELSVTNSRQFKDKVFSVFTAGQNVIEVDLSQMACFDNYGLYVLVSLKRATALRNGFVRLVNPTPPVLQLLQITRMHLRFEITKR